MDDKDFSICFEKKILPQVEEIMTNYGDVFLAWFDVPMTINAEQSRRIYDTVKRLQPNCLINSRLGNGAYDYVSLGDNEYPDAPPSVDLEGDPNALEGYKYSPYGLYETAGTMNSSWGFKYFDQNWITAETVVDRREQLKAKGINYLLNVGPDGLGRIPSFCREVLRKAAK